MVRLVGYTLDVHSPAKTVLVERNYVLNESGEIVMEMCIRDSMKKVLEKKEIKFSFAKYEGAKDVAVIVSEDLKYICTL